MGKWTPLSRNRHIFCPQAKEKSSVVRVTRLTQNKIPINADPTVFFLKLNHKKQMEEIMLNYELRFNFTGSEPLINELDLHWYQHGTLQCLYVICDL